MEGVVSEADGWGEGGIAFGVEGLVSQVGQPRLAGLNILRNFDGLGDGEVGGVRVFAQPIDDEDGNVADEIADGGWHGGAVGQIGNLGFSLKIDTKSGGGDGAVGDREWDKGEGV